jgi:UDP-N-acetylglucosamine 3-dehydrogenase
MPPLRAALIGLGAMGRHHARILRRLPGVQLIAAADPRGDHHRAVPDLPVVPGLDDLLRYRPDYCIVATPTGDHEPTGLALAAAGIHALIEKPLAHDTAAAQRLTAAFHRAGLIAAVGHTELYNPALRELRTRLHHGQLGDLHQLATRRQGPHPNRVHDIGVIKDLATHDLDLAMWITDQPLISIAAHTLTRNGRTHEDLAVALGQLADGTITNHLVNWLTPRRERITTLTGEHGCLTADTLTTRVTYHGHAAAPGRRVGRRLSTQDTIRYARRKHEPLLLEHQTLRDTLLGHTRDIVTMAEATAAVAAADAMLASATSGTTIHITPHDRSTRIAESQPPTQSVPIT